MNSRNVLIVVVVLLAIAVFVWYFAFRTKTAPAGAVPAANSPQTASTTQSLGGSIYQQTQNPIQNKIPDTNPVKNANPIRGVYTNPF